MERIGSNAGFESTAETARDLIGNALMAVDKYVEEYNDLSLNVADRNKALEKARSVSGKIYDAISEVIVRLDSDRLDKLQAAENINVENMIELRNHALELLDKIDRGLVSMRDLDNFINKYRSATHALSNEEIQAMLEKFFSDKK